METGLLPGIDKLGVFHAQGNGLPVPVMPAAQPVMGFGQSDRPLIDRYLLIVSV